MTTPSKIDLEIISEIVKSVRLLGGDFEIAATIGSWGDTLEDEEVLSLLRHWNARVAARAAHGQN